MFRLYISLLMASAFVLGNVEETKAQNQETKGRAPTEGLLAEHAKQYVILKRDIDANLDAGHLAEALDSFERFGRQQLEWYGSEHFTVATTDIYRSELAGCLDKAEDNRVYRSRLVSAFILAGRVRALSASGEFVEAKECSELLLRTRDLFPETSLYFADFLDIRAAVLLSIAQAQETSASRTDALKACKRAIEAYRDVVGDQHPYYANQLAALGAIRADQGAFDEAIQDLTAALKIRRQLVGVGTSPIAATYNNIGYVYFLRGDLLNAEVYLRLALELSANGAGGALTNSAEAIHAVAERKYALLLVKKGEPENALRHLRLSVAWAEKSLSEIHPLLEKLFKDYADVLAALGRTDEASVYADKAALVRHRREGVEFVPTRTDQEVKSPR